MKQNNEQDEGLKLPENLHGRLEIIFRSAHRLLRHKYRKVPLWAFVSDLTSYGHTYSVEVCRHFGWDAHQDGSIKLAPKSEVSDVKENIR